MKNRHVSTYIIGIFRCDWPINDNKNNIFTHRLTRHLNVPLMTPRSNKYCIFASNNGGAGTGNYYSDTHSQIILILYMVYIVSIF